MNKKISLGAAIAFAAIIAGLTFSITIKISMDTFNSMNYHFDENGEIFDKLSKIDSIVNKNFIGDIDDEKILDSIVQGYINGLGDKFSTYYNAEVLEEIKNSSSGQVVNIGFLSAPDESGYIKVIKVYENSPASESGILKGDLIIGINDVNILQDGYQTVLESIKKMTDQTIKITVRREGRDYLLLIKQRKVIVPSIEYALINGNGYVIITEFNDSTFNQFKNAVENLIEEGAEGFIFDVRNNHGGTLNSVVEILDYLLPEGVIVTTDFVNGRTEEIKSAPGELNYPMAVITNKQTASAAELFTAALKDYNKAKQVGVKTYGKGIMQELFTLNDGSAINLTVAYFNPPVSPNFHETGVIPDFEVTMTEETEELYNNYDLNISDDPQFNKAVEIVNSAK